MKTNIVDRIQSYLFKADLPQDKIRDLLTDCEKEISRLKKQKSDGTYYENIEHTRQLVQQFKARSLLWERAATTLELALEYDQEHPSEALPGPEITPG